MKDPKTIPMIRVAFRLPDGILLEREWTVETAGEAPDLAEIPAWLSNPRKSWDHPQAPITFRGDVKPGHEDEARAFVFPDDHGARGEL